jgi:hypothetical protein
MSSAPIVGSDPMWPDERTDRSIVFDINDFDETLTGPREWDLKLLADDEWSTRR